MPNPAFDLTKYHPELEGVQNNRDKPKPKNAAKTTAKTTANDVSDPALQGWKARVCTAAAKDGILHLTNVGDGCFLGLSANKHSGPSTAKFRIKASAGISHFDWLPGGPKDKAQQVTFTMKGGDWEEITVELPATGPLGVVRLYLPMQKELVEIDWIEIQSGKEKHRADF